MGQKPRWERKYENYLKEEPVSEKITEIERESRKKEANLKGKEKTLIENLQAEIDSLKNEKISGNFKTKEEYVTALAERKDLIRKKQKEIIEIKMHTEEEIKKLKENPEEIKKLEGYKNFEKNKNKIANILEYRKNLEKKLAEIPKDNKEQLENKQKEQKAREARIAQYQIEIDEIKKQLKQVKSKEEEQILLFTLKTKLDSMGILQEEQNKSEIEISNLEKNSKNINENMQNKKEMYERKIAKCNMIAANLLKGKNLDEINLNNEYSDKVLKPVDDKISKKIENAREENNNNTKEAEIKDGFYNDYNKGRIENENTALDTYYEDDIKSSRLGDFLRKIKNKFINLIKRNKNNDETKDIEFAEIEEQEIGMHRKMPTLPKKHINKTKTDKDNYETKDSEFSEVDKMETTTNKKITTLQKNHTNKIKLDKHIEQLINEAKEDRLLLDIAENGQEKTFREQYAIRKQHAANVYAKKYGDQYEKQDGATVKKAGTER